MEAGPLAATAGVSTSTANAAPIAAGTQLPGSDPAAAAKPAGRSRMYPDEPRVGVGVVVFRAPHDSRNPEVLLVKRAKEPAMGLWCFPGGSLELGESLAACAVREVLEEASISLRCDTAPGDDSSDATADVSALGSYDPADDSEGFSKGLRRPTAFAAVDSIVRGEGGRVKFHYVVVEVAAMARDPNAQPVAGDDVSDAVWMRVDDLRGLGDKLVVNCERLAREAVERFRLT
ncbi:ADP-ribose pyrophosphatase [Monoraphidium neglectum]|uniref:ADP-ribose pyrophosphatase n=1 Tax=Monoraphidium neglectum TaxID=145388 RepID=A0A0D2NPG3_9CHLO|nr:ADP-ribose pyrophosphatase [Monoraphidium neglectum]KIZ06316.1 ADP-ribose pyrophosphatase [Monoraphidium neglectum]|eukprot:XP_013905335.1 ADP-ribose pyrophosphatase [Monoraphidium neglectum]